MSIEAYTRVKPDGLIRFGSYFLHFVYKKIFIDNEDFILVVVGRKGRGKSYASLSIGEVWSKGLGLDFNVDDNVKHTVGSVLKVVKSNILTAGSVLVIEEMGVSANSRNFMSNVNKSLSTLAQTIRLKHYFIIVNVPKYTMIDKNVRMLTNARLEILRKDMSANLSYGKVYLLEYEDAQRQKEWRRFLRFRVMGKRKLHVIDSICFGLPSRSVCEEYELKKSKYTDKLYDDVFNELEYEVGEIEGDDSDGGEVGGGIGRSAGLAVRLFNECSLSKKQIAIVFGIRNKVVSGWFRASDRAGVVVLTGRRLSDSDFYAKGLEYWRGVLKSFENKGEDVDVE